MTIRLWSAVVALSMSVVLHASAQDANYPTKAITVVLPFGPGSGTDTTTRIITKYLSESLGQQFIIDAKPGANGSIAATTVARAKPDGYTLFATTNTTHSANPFLLKTLAYDPQKDFKAIARTGDLPFMLVVDAKIPVKSVKELIAYGKANQGKLTFASGSSSSHVSGATFARQAGLDMQHVPYKSNPPALTDVIGGRVTMMFVDILTGMPMVSSGDLRALAVTTKARSALAPDLPSMDEAGVPGFDITSWQGWFAPAGTPNEIVVKLNTELRKVINRPDVKAELAARGMDAFSSSPEEMDQFVKDQMTLWRRLVSEAGIERQ
ncbi:Bug family tripartite tricarboxylate transporter substrate binding protein [Tardiphaga sp. 803_E3_N1_3]|uniref:Bug family tripartite tricarboxylate transporter substrate binding protein n=1 Tax=Tardiphaga sp. 803_E3_N1_3 TaxID=3240785 RepID=UPI003F276C01